MPVTVFSNPAQQESARQHVALCRDVLAHDMPASASDAGKRGYAECVHLLLLPREPRVPDAYMTGFFILAAIGVGAWLVVVFVGGVKK